MSVHADPPPPLVPEPVRYSYETGPQLGKGGFAICHRAELLDEGKPTGKLLALKIVKSQMEPAKLAQKVKLVHSTPQPSTPLFTVACSHCWLNVVCHRASTTLQTSSPEYRTLPQGLFI